VPVTWTEARRRGHDVLDVARLAGIADRKGAIAPGMDADLVVWRPEERFTVSVDRLEHRHKLTPYAGAELDGVVERTYVRGQLVFDRGEHAPRPGGRLL
jgi:allantoinase